MSGRAADRPHLVRLAASAAVVLLAFSLFPDTAAADSRLCRQLEIELASAGRPAGGQVRRYEKAIRAQEIELDKTRALASNAGCGSFFGALRGQCGSLNSTLSRMEKNLASLRRQRDDLAGDPRRDRARLQAALDANGCRATREASVSKAESAPPMEPTAASPEPAGVVPGIASGASPKGFSVVAGGGYAPKRPAGVLAVSEAADSVHVEMVAGVADKKDTPAAADEAVEAPDLFAGKPDEPERETVTSSVGERNPAERRVRVVGPAFLPDPEEAIDLRAPGRREAR